MWMRDGLSLDPFFTKFQVLVPWTDKCKYTGRAVWKETPLDILEGVRESLRSRGEWVLPFFFSVSRGLFIGISLRLEFEDWHSQLGRTPIFKSYVFMLTGTKHRVLITSSRGPHARRIRLLLQKVWERGQRKRKEERSQQYQKEKRKKKTHKILLCTLWFVWLRRTAWLYPAARIHYRDLLTGRCTVIGCIF